MCVVNGTEFHTKKRCIEFFPYNNTISSCCIPIFFLLKKKNNINNPVLIILRTGSGYTVCCLGLNAVALVLSGCNSFML